MKLLFSAGEASGDAYAAEIARRLSASLPIEEMAAIGGPRLKTLGVEMLADSSRWGAIGVAQSLKVAPKIAWQSLRAMRRIKQGPPGLFIPVDFGFLNLRLARLAKTNHWKVLYFIPPSSWRRDRQGKDLPDVADSIVTPFPWSAQILRQAGAVAWFWGHPLVDMVGPVDEAAERAGIAILPGSRIHEAKHNLPLLAKACAGMPEPLTMVIAPTLAADAVQQIWSRHGGGPYSVAPSVSAALKGARTALVCSGTATLEAALCDCPSVIVYALSPAMLAEAKLFGLGKRLRHIGLPNILLDRRAIPELVNPQPQPSDVSAALAELLADGPARQAQLEAFAEVRAICNGPGCLDRTAKLAMEMLGLSAPRG